MQPEQAIQKAINAVFVRSQCAGRGCAVGIVHSSTGHVWTFRHRTPTNSMIMEVTFADWYFLNSHGKPEHIFAIALAEFLRDAHDLSGGEHFFDPGLIAALHDHAYNNEEPQKDDLMPVEIHADTHQPALSFQTNVHVLAWGPQYFPGEDVQ